jgi:hypothetical protein
MDVERTIEQWSIGGTRLSWSAVFAGWAVGMAAQLTLTLLGLAVGAWSIDLKDAEPVGGSRSVPGCGPPSPCSYPPSPADI